MISNVMNPALERFRYESLRCRFVMLTRPGPNIPLNLPIIQIIILYLSTPLFERKVPIILKKADKMQMKHEYDQNVYVHFGQQVLDYMKIS